MIRQASTGRLGWRIALLALLLTGCAAPIVPIDQQSSPQGSSMANASSSPRSSAAATARPSSSPSGTQGSGQIDSLPSSSQLTEIKGEFDYTNDVINTYYVEHAVALLDMYGFVIRDEEWELPIDGQVLGYLNLDESKMHGAYQLQLPALPRGTFADVDNDGQQDTGVQIFAVSYSPNLAGGPYSIGDDRSRGWPTYLASTVNDPENNDEVTGGKLVVWAPDDQQQFPTGFGDDGLLFTADDPIGALPASWSIVDLDKQPFAIAQQNDPDVKLFEPADAGLKDYSDLSYTEAFDKMFAQVSREYAFNGIEGKAPNWDQLAQELKPRVAEAERRRDAKAFFLVMHDFANAFNDGHVGVSDEQYAVELLREQAIGGYGLNIRELDDKRVIVTNIVENGPAAKAGIQVGAQIKSFNNQPIADAIGAVKPPIGGPFSTEFARRYQQQAFLVRAPINTQATWTYANPGSGDQTATLTASDELDSYYFPSLYADSDPAALPVEFRITDSGVGYVKLNSNYDDLNLIIRLFERALDTFEQNNVGSVIFDLRRNGGGANLGLAGFLTDKEIPMAQLQYFSEASGTFEAEGTPDKVTPNERQFRFDKMALLVDQACASACELEAYGFSKVPGMIVVGQYPTAGVEAEVSRGQYKLPGGISLQVPTGRFVLPDGSIFLEGQGVQPTVRVPIDEKTVLSKDDLVFNTAEDAVLDR